MLAGTLFNTVFPRFSLTETDAFGILPDDISEVEALDMKIKVDARNAKDKAEAARDSTKTKSKKKQKKPKTRPYASLAPTKS